MTRQRNWKRRIRERMRSSGVSYTAARAQLQKAADDSSLVPVSGPFTEERGTDMNATRPRISAARGVDIPDHLTGPLLAVPPTIDEVIAEFGRIHWRSENHVLVVPRVKEDGPYDFRDLVPSSTGVTELARELSRRLDREVLVEPPMYQGVVVSAQVHAALGSDPEAVRVAAHQAVIRYLHPYIGGADGTGWPAGEAVDVDDLRRVLLEVDGIDAVDHLAVTPADPLTGEVGNTVSRVAVGPRGDFVHLHRLLTSVVSRENAMEKDTG